MRKDEFSALRQHQPHQHLSSLRGTERQKDSLQQVAGRNQESPRRKGQDESSTASERSAVSEGFQRSKSSQRSERKKMIDFIV